MANDLIRQPDNTLGHVAETVEEFAAFSRAESTRRGYATDFRQWSKWAREHRCVAMPATPESLCEWLAEEAPSHKPGTLQRWLASLSVAHQIAGYPKPTPCQDPLVHSVMKGIRRTYGAAPRRKTPILLEGLRAALNTCDDTLMGLRDRSIMTLAWTGAFRRSEVAALQVEDLEHEEGGTVVLLRRSKTDQEGWGRRVGLPHAEGEGNQALCPPCRLMDWLEAARIDAGAIYRACRGGFVADEGICDRTVRNIIYRRMALAGLDGDFAGHSMRAGLVTQAALNDVDVSTIARHTGHRRIAQVQDYIRTVDPFKRNAARMAGL